MRPAIGLLGRDELIGIGQRAVPLGGVLRRVPKRDMRLAGDHRRLPGGFRLGQGSINRRRIVAVDFQHMPARGAEARHLIGAIRQIDPAVDGDIVVVPQHDQARELVPPGEADRLLADALHQAAVAGDHIGVVIHQTGAKAGAQHFLCHGKADGVGNALTQRAGGGLDPLGVAVFRVPGGFRAPLAEIADLA